MNSQFVWLLELRVISPLGHGGHSEAATSTQNVCLVGSVNMGYLQRQREHLQLWLSAFGIHTEALQAGPKLLDIHLLDFLLGGYSLLVFFGIRATVLHCSLLSIYKKGSTAHTCKSDTREFTSAGIDYSAIDSRSLFLQRQLRLWRINLFAHRKFVVVVRVIFLIQHGFGSACLLLGHLHKDV